MPHEFVDHFVKVLKQTDLEDLVCIQGLKEPNEKVHNAL
ncbi:hypothetical protein SAMN04515695_5597 [Pseudovibrio sp. Tun.PSC04-5.I4]|nr:hypothetical protein SAMN04515695_5597 [Pseudovibrio sp. Tun.PSC04-5.I4]